MIFGGYHLNKKKKLNKSGYPDEAIKTLARCFYPSMVEFFNSEEGQREYEEWLKEQEALQALPVAAEKQQDAPSKGNALPCIDVSHRGVSSWAHLLFFSLNLLTHGSRLHFSNIPPDRHSKSNRHSLAGHCR